MSMDEPLNSKAEDAAREMAVVVNGLKQLGTALELAGETVRTMAGWLEERYTDG